MSSGNSSINLNTKPLYVTTHNSRTRANKKKRLEKKLLGRKCSRTNFDIVYLTPEDLTKNASNADMIHHPKTVNNKNNSFQKPKEENSVITDNPNFTAEEETIIKYLLEKEPIMKKFQSYLNQEIQKTIQDLSTKIISHQTEITSELSQKVEETREKSKKMEEKINEILSIKSEVGVEEQRGHHHNNKKINNQSLVSKEEDEKKAKLNGNEPSPKIRINEVLLRLFTCAAKLVVKIDTTINEKMEKGHICCNKESKTPNVK